MQHLTLSQLRSAHGAGGVLAVTLKAQGASFPRPDRAAAMKAAHEALSHNDWLREKLARSAQDPRPRIPHDQAMSAAQAIIDPKRKAHAKDTPA